MIFRIIGSLQFASTANRNSMRTTINNALSGRGTTVVYEAGISSDFTYKGRPAIVFEFEDENTGDAGIIYALIEASTLPMPGVGSNVNHHTCRHDEGTGKCLNTARKVWT